MNRRQRRAVAKRLEQRDTLLRNADNMTNEEAMKYWNWSLLGAPAKDKPEVALAGIHKARLNWDDATAEMRRRSEEWLRIRGYDVPEGRVVQ